MPQPIPSADDFLGADAIPLLWDETPGVPLTPDDWERLLDEGAGPGLVVGAERRLRGEHADGLPERRAKDD